MSYEFCDVLTHPQSAAAESRLSWLRLLQDIASY